MDHWLDLALSWHVTNSVHFAKLAYLIHLVCVTDRPVTSLGHQGGRRVFWEGDKFFKLCPIVSKYVRHIFSRGGEIFSRGGFAPLRPPGYGPGCRPWIAYVTCIGEKPEYVTDDKKTINQCSCQIKHRDYKLLVLFLRNLQSMHALPADLASSIQVRTEPLKLLMHLYGMDFLGNVALGKTPRSKRICI